MTDPSGPIALIGGYDENGNVVICSIDDNGGLVVGSSTVDAANVTYTPGTLADWDGGADPGNQDGANDQLAERVKDLETSIEQLALPKRGSRFIDEMTVLTGAALTLSNTASMRYNFNGIQSTPADGDELTWSWLLDSGTYTLYILGYTFSSLGIMDIGVKHSTDSSWDDQITGMDWYSAGVVYNVTKSGAITLDIGGLWRFRILINGKNASASNYYYAFTKAWIKQTTD